MLLWNRYIFYPQILVTQVLNSMVCGVGMNERRDQTGTYLERRSQGDANQQQQNGEVSQLIDPLHVNAGQSLPLSDWNVGIRNGSDGFQAGPYGKGGVPVVHDGAVVVCSVLVVGVFEFEVVGHIWRDVIPVDADVLVAIAPGVLMVESQSMIELMLNDPKASVVQADESISGLGEQQISLDQDFRRTCGSREMLWNRYIFYPQILVTQVLNSMVCGVGMNERRDQTGTYLERRSQGDANQQQQNGEVSQYNESYFEDRSSASVQLIDPLHIDAGQPLPLSDWNIGIRDGSDGFQAGLYGEGGVPVVHDGAVVLEVEGHIWRDVIPVDADVLVAITPGVLMVEAQSMIELMLNDPKASVVQADESISGLGEQQISLDQDFRRTCGSREMLWNRYIFYPQILVTQVLNSMVCGVGMNERRDQTGTYLERRSQGDANQQQQNGEVSQVHVSSVFRRQPQQLLLKSLLDFPTRSLASIQLIDPLHINVGQPLPLSDWNVGIWNGNDGFQAGLYGEGGVPVVHDGAVVVCSVLVVGVFELEVVGHIWRDVIPVDVDVLVAIAPGVLMVESQSMIELMLNDPKASVVQADESISGLGEQQISLDQDFRRTCGSREMLWNRYIFYPQILVTQVLNSMVCGVGMNERRDQTGTYLERRSQGDANQQQQNGEVSQVHVSSVFRLINHSRRCRSAGFSASVQLIDPLHIGAGQSLPLSDWNIGIRNGSDGFQAGLYGEGGVPVVHDGAVVLEVEGHIWRDVIPVDADVLVAIAPGVLMVEAQSMIELMLNDPSVHTA
ncbi:hypothetical protein DNTS_017771 [Danionella cerebrum]|uniref:Uncharacterized protein n=1 Tax=Danionella cerebrum TaxID=2873325 RepID=A0A553RHX8_9TELE|nr:hypothetical protein DNTS_017771 [Danionella translucida]